MKIVFDSDALIKIARCGAKEAVVATFEVIIPEAVEREAISEGLAAGFADAALLSANRESGRIQVPRTPIPSAEAEALPQGGDREVYALYRSLEGTGGAVVATDDQKVIRRLQMLNARFVTPGALLVALCDSGRSPEEALRWLEQLGPLISPEEFRSTLDALENRRGGE